MVVTLQDPASDALLKQLVPHVAGRTARQTAGWTRKRSRVAEELQRCGANVSSQDIGDLLVDEIVAAGGVAVGAAVGGAAAPAWAIAMTAQLTQQQAAMQQGLGAVQAAMQQQMAAMQTAMQQGLGAVQAAMQQQMAAMQQDLGEQTMRSKNVEARLLNGASSNNAHALVPLMVWVPGPAAAAQVPAGFPRTVAAAINLSARHTHALANAYGIPLLPANTRLERLNRYIGIHVL